MTVTPLPLKAEAPDRYADHASGLRYLWRIGPAVPGLDSTGLGYVRGDLLARAASSEAQGRAAGEAGNFTLQTICETTARICRETAAQVLTYALTPTWSVVPEWGAEA